MDHYVFFDLDKTILSINSGKILFKTAYKRGILSTRKMGITYGLELLNRLNLVDPLKVIRKFPPWLAGTSEIEFTKLCREIVDNLIKENLRPQIEEEINFHRNNGVMVGMLSATVSHICEPIAEHLVLDHVLCTRLEVKNGLFTGKSEGNLCFGMEKLKKMIVFLEGIQVPLNNVWYYGDSIHDLPVLESVGYPVCVYPDRKLEKIARQHGWRMIGEPI